MWLARLITGLFDNAVVPDETEKLVIALCRAKVLHGPPIVTLLSPYFDEIREDNQTP